MKHRSQTIAFVRLRLAVTVGVSLTLSFATACGAARAGRFEAFAVAGTSYTQASSEFLRQSLEVAIDRDTLELRKQRPALDAANRVTVLSDQDKLMRERIEILKDLDRHDQVLRQYFEALSRLATSKEDANAAAAATKLAGELGGMTNALAQKSIAGRPLNAILGQASGLVVGAFRNRALARHLNENAVTIERELLLQEAALEILADEFIADRTALQNDERRTKVTVPFRDAATLPTTWDTDRKRYLLAELDVAKARAAQDAAKQLRLTYQSLAGGGSEGGVSSLEASIARLNSFVKDFAATKTTTP